MLDPNKTGGVSPPRRAAKTSLRRAATAVRFHTDRKREVLQRLRAHGIPARGSSHCADLVTGDRAVAIQVGRNVAPGDISYLVVTASRYAVLIFVADNFSPRCAGRAKKHGVILYTMKKFREQFPMPSDRILRGGA